MKRLFWIAGAAGLMWTAPALGEAPQAQANDAAQVQSHNDKKHFDGAGRGQTEVRDQSAEAVSRQMAGHAQHANQAQGEQAQREAARMAHDRAMSHAANDGNAAHADVANRSAMHMAAPGSRSQMESESHDAAGQMRTAHEHGELRGMEGGGAMEGGNGEGGGRMSGSQGGR